jgi:hypothetical protein
MISFRMMSLQLRKGGGSPPFFTIIFPICIPMNSIRNSSEDTFQSIA